MEKDVKRCLGVIDAMTDDELSNPDFIDEPRIERIARGSGTTRKHVVELLQQFNEIRQLMARCGSGFATLPEGTIRQ
ncbi:hypothetical protein OAS39_11535 [Pirellulales bacterium]|nr:hypothetical protein [Pirellulales bacterium]